MNIEDQQKIHQWKKSLYDYQKQKRTKKPFGKDPQIYETKIVHSSQIKEKQRQYHPILQRYTHQHSQKQAEQKQQQKQHLIQAKHLKAAKPNTNYDIINLYPYTGSVNPQQANYQQWSKNKNTNNPIRNVYNIINGQSLPNGYYKNRQIKLQNNITSRKIYADKLKNRQFDIVKAQYVQRNEEKQSRQRRQQQQKIYQKLSKSHQYDNILQRYYNSEQQWKFQQQLYKSQLCHGKDYQKRLPQSYQNRQPYQPSYSQQEPLSPALKKILQKQQNSLRRHQLRYALEQEYRLRNDQDYQKQQQIVRNRVHQGKILQSMAKQYDIINNRLVQTNRSMMYEKKLVQHPYSYAFLNQQPKSSASNHSRSNSIHHQPIYHHQNNSNNWDTQSQAYSQRSKSSAARSQNSKYSIKSGGFC